MTEPLSSPAVPVPVAVPESTAREPSAVSTNPASTTLAWLRDLSLALLIAILMILFLYRPVKVDGVSMMPTLQNGERLFINQFDYRFGLERIHRGDTVVFWFPGDTSKSYIKRVIGLPGDRIEINDGYVAVNGKKLQEKYIPQQYRDDQNYGPITIPPHDYFVLGDHRNESSDSRSWGFVPQNYIYGKAVFVFWPLKDMGTLN